MHYKKSQIPCHLASNLVTPMMLRDTNILDKTNIYKTCQQNIQTKCSFCTTELSANVITKLHTDNQNHFYNSLLTIILPIFLIDLEENKNLLIQRVLRYGDKV